MLGMGLERQSALHWGQVRMFRQHCAVQGAVQRGGGTTDQAADAVPVVADDERAAAAAVELLETHVAAQGGHPAAVLCNR